jgi:hypothetical protein
VVRVTEYSLYRPALIVTAVLALIIPVSPFSSPFRAAIVQPSMEVAGGVAVILFLRMVLDPRCRRGVRAQAS